MSITIGKSAAEVERPLVPRGIVHQRRSLFANQNGDKNVSFATPEDSPPSTSALTRKELSETRQNHVKIEVTRVRGPPELFRRSTDEDVTQAERRVILMRHETENSLRIQETRFDHNVAAHRGLRRYPIVTVKLGDPPPPKFNSSWQALPPKKNLHSPYSTVHRNYSSTPSGLNMIRAVEGTDSLVVDYAPNYPKYSSTDDEAPITGDDVESEIAAREEELEQAKLQIHKLSMDLERLERDKRALEETIVIEEDLDIEELVAHSDDESDRDRKVKLDAETILRECNRMMHKLKEEEEADEQLLEKIQRGDSTREEVEGEIMRLQRQVAELNAMGVELPSLSVKQGTPRGREDTSQILSLKDQAVMFSTGSTARQEALISRLERELTDAQTCNHRLNAQLGSLASTGDSALKREYIEIKKALKERNDELDTLRKKVQRFDKDRQQWDAQKKQLESKLPVDVQQLMAQKKELTAQLDREQTEKHELFMQMNTYIAQLADAGDAEAYKKEVDLMKSKNAELQSKYHLLEQDLSRSKDEVSAVRRSFDSERRQLTSEAEDARKELNMKAAALQSLMLAKQDNGKIEQLTEENKRMASSVEELQTSLRDAQLQMAQQLSSKLEQMSTNSSNAAQTELQRRLDETEARLKVLQEKIDTAEEDKKQLQNNLNLKNREYTAVSDQLRSAQQDIEVSSAKHSADLVQLKAELAELKREGDDETRQLKEREKVLNTTVEETCAKLDAAKVALFAAESRAEQAETDLKAIDAQMKNAERRAQQLQAQLNAAGDETKEMELLRDELKKAEERHNLLLSRHQKAEAAVQENTNSHRMQMDELQQRLEKAEMENREVMLKQNKLEENERQTSQKLTSMEQVRAQADQEREQHAEKVRKLEKELETARSEKQGQKVAVAEEITTLTNLTHSLRTENSTFQEQISLLERDNHHMKEELEEKEYENEQLCKELEQARAMADTERQTMTMLKSSQQMGEEETVQLKQDLQHEKEARKKAEAEIIAKFGVQIEEISKERTRLREEKSHLEMELADVRKQLSSLEEEQASSKSRQMEEETKLKAEASKLQTTFTVLEEGRKEMEEKLKEANNAKEELQKTMEKKVKDAKEETEASRRETESQRARVQELEEERTREVGSNDEEKKRLLEELRFYREKADNQQLEVANLKTKLASSATEITTLQSKIDQLTSQLEKLQSEYDEMKQVLHSSQESVEKMKESEQMGAKIKKQLEELETEHKEKIKAEMTRRAELERKLDELQSSKTQIELLQQTAAKSREEELTSATEKIADLEGKLSNALKKQEELVIAEHKISDLEAKLSGTTSAKNEELALAQQKISDLETKLSGASNVKQEELTVAEQRISDLEGRLAISSKAQSELLVNVKNLTGLVESESKRIEETAAEKRRWQAKAEELERNMKNAAEDNEEVRHLVAENARMAGELLQLRSQRAGEDESSAKELQERLADMEQEKSRLMVELQTARSRSEELNRTIIQSDKRKRDEVSAVQRELDREKSERERLQEKIDHMYQNGHSNGPQRTLSNMSGVTMLTSRDFTEIDDVDELHAMLDKQGRIITVLRRKLLKLQQ